MLSKKILVVAACIAANAGAATIEQLAKKNSELLELKADVAIAEHRDRLKKLSAPTQISPGQAITPVQVRPKKTVAAEIDDIDFVGAGGDVSNPVAKFVLNGQSQVLKKAGDQINGWTIVRVSATEVVLSKQQKKELIEKSLYLASRNKLTEPRQALVPQSMGIQNSGAGTYVPAVQPPLK